MNTVKDSQLVRASMLIHSDEPGDVTIVEVYRETHEYSDSPDAEVIRTKLEHIASGDGFERFNYL